MPSSHAATAAVLVWAVLAGSCSTGSSDAGSAAAELSVDADRGVAAAQATADETFDEDFLNARGGSRFPALDDPALVVGSTATWLDPDDIVMGIVSDSGVAQAYPVDQMVYHHVANTSLAGEPFVVTY